MTWVPSLGSALWKERTTSSKLPCHARVWHGIPTHTSVNKWERGGAVITSIVIESIRLARAKRKKKKSSLENEKGAIYPLRMEAQIRTVSHFCFLPALCVTNEMQTRAPGGHCCSGGQWWHLGIDSTQLLFVICPLWPSRPTLILMNFISSQEITLWLN